MQDDFDPAGVCSNAAVGPPWPVRIRLATSAPLASIDRALYAARPAIEKLKILLQRLTCHPHPAPWWRASLLSVAMLLGACSGGGDDAPSIPTAPAAAPPSVALDVAPDTVHETSTADLNWSSTDASECVASGGWSGLKSLTGSESTGALMSTTAYTLTCTGPGGTAGHTVTANVTPANTGAPGPSVSLSASPPSCQLWRIGHAHLELQLRQRLHRIGQLERRQASLGYRKHWTTDGKRVVCIDVYRRRRRGHPNGERCGQRARRAAATIDCTQCHAVDDCQWRHNDAKLDGKQCHRVHRHRRVERGQGVQRIRGSRRPRRDHHVRADLLRSRRDRLSGCYCQRDSLRLRRRQWH